MDKEAHDRDATKKIAEQERLRRQGALRFR
jgi:hypothetical protein